MFTHEKIFTTFKNSPYSSGLGLAAGFLIARKFGAGILLSSGAAVIGGLVSSAAFDKGPVIKENVK
jgi:hypothetical protein